MDLIQEYLNLAQTCASTDYTDKKSVRLHNKSVARMHEIAEKIGHKQTTETMDDFAKLLDVHENKTHVWAAIHILERMPADKGMEGKALEIIKKQANGNSSDAIGFKIWLENYQGK